MLPVDEGPDKDPRGSRWSQGVTTHGLPPARLHWAVVAGEVFVADAFTTEASVQVTGVDGNAVEWPEVNAHVPSAPVLHPAGVEPSSHDPVTVAPETVALS